MKKYYISLLLGIIMLSFSCNKEENNSEQNNHSFIDNSDYTPKDLEEINYYRSISLTLRGSELKKELHLLLENTHNQLLYTPEIWNACDITDEDPENPNNVLLIYGWPKGQIFENKHMRSLNKNEKNRIGNIPTSMREKKWEREHVFAKSLANPKLVTDRYEGYSEIGLTAGTDAHNLRPINGEWNNTRSNNKFIDGKGNSKLIGYNYWYPGDEWKGDVARMIMYMFVRYGDQCLPTSIGIGQEVYIKDRDGMIDLFLKWNEEDPVSPIEIKRNKYHGNIKNQYAQGNRNPFIDNPYLANLIWGDNNGKIKTAENKWTKK